MKKDIFINISIITALTVFRVPAAPESLNFITMIPVLIYIAAIIQVKDIFISREGEVKRRAPLYTFIIACYLIVAASVAAGVLDMDILKFCFDNSLIAVYLLTIMMYLKAPFGGIKKA